MPEGRTRCEIGRVSANIQLLQMKNFLLDIEADRSCLHRLNRMDLSKTKTWGLKWEWTNRDERDLLKYDKVINHARATPFRANLVRIQMRGNAQDDPVLLRTQSLIRLSVVGCR